MRKKTKKSILKKVIGQVHLWLGLATGIVVFFSMLGAAVFVWEEELIDWWYQEYIFVAETATEKLSISELMNIVRTT